jgi:hypothetical protein
MSVFSVIHLDKYFIMKIRLLILSFFYTAGAFSQADSAFKSTYDYFRANNILLNVLHPPKGYSVYYSCDSMLFIRGDFSDTIKIWTPALEWVHDLESFREIITNPEYGKTIFAKSISSDGRIMVNTYMETQFIFRNDSLFEIDDTISKPPEYFDLTVRHVQGLIDDATYKAKTDSIELIYNNKHAYIAKLIFAKDMFKAGRKKVKLSRKVNYLKDEILLEKEWMEDGKQCFVIRINNIDGGNETSYAYAINEDLKFVWWQGCKSRQ